MVDTEQEYTNSIGLFSIIESLQNWTFNRAAPIMDTVIVNLLTLIRNNFNKDSSVKEIADLVIKDMEMFDMTFYAYTEQRKHSTFTPYILYYLPNYDAIPSIHRRKDNDTRVKLEAVCKYIREKLPNVKTNESVNISSAPINVYFVLAGNQYVYPHFHVVDSVRKLNSIIDKEKVSSLQRKYILISHCPLDFHMWNKIPYRLFETYTGKLKDYKDLGHKVFKVPYVPFNKYTHVLFGDSIHLKPMVVRNTKKAFLDLAFRDKWPILGDEKIKSSITQFDPTTKLFINNLVV